MGLLDVFMIWSVLSIVIAFILFSVFTYFLGWVLYSSDSPKTLSRIEPIIEDTVQDKRKIVGIFILAAMIAIMATSTITSLMNTR